MNKRRWMLIGWLLITVILAGLSVMPTAWGMSSQDNWTVPTRTFTPPPPPTSTNTPTPTPTPTPNYIYLPLVLRIWPPPLPPIPAGTTVRFKSAWYDIPFEGVVTSSEVCTILYDHDTPYYPQGTFAVVLMDVTNHGLRSDEVGQHNSFKAQDSVGRIFDLASLNVHQAAEYTYQRESLYYPIQPGFTVPLVFVFDVLPQSEGLRLVAVEGW